MRRGGRKRLYNEWLKDKSPRVPRSTQQRLQDSENEDEDCQQYLVRDPQPNADASAGPSHPLELVRTAKQQHQPREDLPVTIQDVQESRPSSSSGSHAEVCINASHQQSFRMTSDDVLEELLDGERSLNGDIHSEDILNAEDIDLQYWGDLTQEPNPSTTSDDQPIEEPSTADKRKPRKGLNRPLIPGVKTTVFECLLMCMEFGMRHGLTAVAIKDLLKLMNVIFGEDVVPESEEIFHSIFKGSLTMQFYFCCTFCGRLLGEFSSFKGKSSVICDNCNKETRVKNFSSNNFFVYIPIEQQLRGLFENNADILHLLNYRSWRKDTPGSICDVFDGSVYKSFSENGLLLDSKNFSVTMNTDGSPVYRSASNTMYPVQFRINEFPLDMRFDVNNCFVAAVWFGNKDPNMSALLQPFVNDAQRLYTEGFSWKHVSGEVVQSKMVTLNCVLDSVAKPKVQNITQFNGYYGCNYCEHPGIMIEDHNHPRYLMPADDFDVVINDKLESEYQLTWVDPKTHQAEVVSVSDRKDKTIRETMLDIQLGRVKGPVKGVLGCSPLYPLAHLDLVFGFNIDSLHAVLLGVCRLVTTLQLQSASKGMPFYLREKIHLLTQRMKYLAPPSNISRRPRPMEEINMWKGNEWRAYLLYYSLPCLADILPLEYFRHHCLLVSAMYTLHSNNISMAELRESAFYLKRYVTEFQTLYGLVNMNFNVHLLLHLPKCVEMYGPASTFSAFCFEAGNGQCVRLVKGTRFVAKQIAQKYINFSCLSETISMYKVSDRVKTFGDELFSFNRSKFSLNIYGVSLLGDMSRFNASLEEQTAFRLAGVVPQPFCYKKMIKDGIMYFARSVRKEEVKYDDSAARLTDDSYVYIERIVNVLSPSNESEVYITCRKIRTLRSPIVQHDMDASARHIKICPTVVFGDLVCIPANRLKFKVLLIVNDGETFKDSYVIDMLTHIERD